MPAYQQIFFWYYDELSAPYTLITYLKGEGVDGGTVFTDEVAGRTWAAYSGSPRTSTTRFRYGSSSIYAGSAETLQLTSPRTDFQLNTDYTVEMWVYSTGVTGAVTPLYLYEACGIGKDIRVSVSPTDNPNAVRHSVGAFFVDVNDGGGSPFGRWLHIYAGKQGNTIYIGMNGVVTSITAVSETIIVPGLVLLNSHASFLGGGGTYVDEFWILKGLCRYTTNFTPTDPPTLP